MLVIRYADNITRVRRMGSKDNYRFGQIKREGRRWTAEIRESQTGALVRFAGIWATKRDAVEECEHILEREG